MEKGVSPLVKGFPETAFVVGGQYNGDVIVKHLRDFLVAFGDGAEGHLAAQDFLDFGFADVLVDFLSGNFAFHLHIEGESLADTYIGSTGDDDTFHTVFLYVLNHLHGNPDAAVLVYQGIVFGAYRAVKFDDIVKR